jgi:hypothetical protein
LSPAFCGTSCASAAPCPRRKRTCCLGRCANVNSDPLNCGGCTQNCALGQKCVKGSCAGKPVACRPGQNCQTTRCVCPKKFPLCGPTGICVK